MRPSTSPTLRRPLEQGPADDSRTDGRQVSFDCIARAYRWLEYLALGPMLQRTRGEFLPCFQTSRRALVFGDGDGRFLAALMRQNPMLKAEAVDTSGLMLKLLRERCRRGERLRTHRQSALTYEPDGAPDLVATHFFLDCLHQKEVEELVERVAPAMAPKALWVVSEFREVGIASCLYIRMLYLAFRLLTGLRVKRVPEYAMVFRKAGFVLVSERARLGGLLRAELWRKKERDIPFTHVPPRT